MSKKTSIVPFGWQRRRIETSIAGSSPCVTYVSPSGVVLSSIVEVCQYLEKEDVCKCGLQCPIHVPKVFSFNPEVQSENLSKNDWSHRENNTESHRKNCQHWNKLQKTQIAKKKPPCHSELTAKPPPKLLIIREGGQLRSVISDKRKVTTGAKKVIENTRKDKNLLDSTSTSSSASTAVRKSSTISPTKLPLFESGVFVAAVGSENSTNKSKNDFKLQWIKADDEASHNDAESGNELCFSPDSKKSPPMSFPQSLIPGLSSPPSMLKQEGRFSISTIGQSRALFMQGANTSGLQTLHGGIEPVHRFGMSAFPGSNFIMKNDPNAGGRAHQNTFPQEIQRHPLMTVKSEQGPQFSQSSPFGFPTNMGTNQPRGFVQPGVTPEPGGASWQQSQNNMASGNMKQMNMPGMGVRGQLQTIKSPTRPPTPQRFPLGSPTMLSPTSPYGFQMGNSGQNLPLTSPGHSTDPSPFSNRSQSRSSSVGTPAPSPGGPWQVARPHMTDFSRPQSRSSNVATPGPDVSPSQMQQWNPSGGNAGMFAARNPGAIRGFGPNISPGPTSPFSPTRLPQSSNVPLRLPLNPQGSQAEMEPHGFALNQSASQQLRFHSQNVMLRAQQAENAKGSRHPHFAANSQFPGAGLVPPQHVDNVAALQANMFRPCPPYRSTRIQFARINETDSNSQPQFPFRPMSPQIRGMQYQNPMMQQRFAFEQQQLQWGQFPGNLPTLRQGQCFQPGMMHPRMPSTAPLVQRPAKSKRSRRKKVSKPPPKPKEEPQPALSTNFMSAEFPDFFEPAQMPHDLINIGKTVVTSSASNLPHKAPSLSIPRKLNDIVLPSTACITVPSLVLPTDMQAPLETGVDSVIPNIQKPSCSPLKPPKPELASSTESLPPVLAPTLPSNTHRDSGRGVITPPLPVLSPTCLFEEHTAADDNDEFSDFASPSPVVFDFSTPTSKKALVTSTSTGFLGKNSSKSVGQVGSILSGSVSVCTANAISTPIATTMVMQPNVSVAEKTPTNLPNTTTESSLPSDLLPVHHHLKPVRPGQRDSTTLVSSTGKIFHLPKTVDGLPQDRRFSGYSGGGAPQPRSDIRKRIRSDPYPTSMVSPPEKRRQTRRPSYDLDRRSIDAPATEIISSVPSSEPASSFLAPSCSGVIPSEPVIHVMQQSSMLPGSPQIPTPEPDCGSRDNSPKSNAECHAVSESTVKLGNFSTTGKKTIKSFTNVPNEDNSNTNANQKADSLSPSSIALEETPLQGDDALQLQPPVSEPADSSSNLVVHETSVNAEVSADKTQNTTVEKRNEANDLVPSPIAAFDGVEKDCKDATPQYPVEQDCVGTKGVAEENIQLDHNMAPELCKPENRSSQKESLPDLSTEGVCVKDVVVEPPTVSPVVADENEQGEDSANISKPCVLDETGKVDTVPSPKEAGLDLLPITSEEKDYEAGKADTRVNEKSPDLLPSKSEQMDCEARDQSLTEDSVEDVKGDLQPCLAESKSTIQVSENTSSQEREMEVDPPLVESPSSQSTNILDETSNMDVDNEATETQPMEKPVSELHDSLKEDIFICVAENNEKSVVSENSDRSNKNTIHSAPYNSNLSVNSEDMACQAKLIDSPLEASGEDVSIPLEMAERSSPANCEKISPFLCAINQEATDCLQDSATAAVKPISSPVSQATEALTCQESQVDTQRPRDLSVEVAEEVKLDEGDKEDALQSPSLEAALKTSHVEPEAVPEDAQIKQERKLQKPPLKDDSDLSSMAESNALEETSSSAVNEITTCARTTSILDCEERIQPDEVKKTVQNASEDTCSTAPESETVSSIVQTQTGQAEASPSSTKCEASKLSTANSSVSGVPEFGISSELTSTVIRQLSNYNTILKNLLVSGVANPATIAQLTSAASAQNEQQQQVLSALISNTMKLFKEDGSSPLLVASSSSQHAPQPTNDAREIKVPTLGLKQQESLNDSLDKTAIQVVSVTPVKQPIQAPQATVSSSEQAMGTTIHSTAHPDSSHLSRVEKNSASGPVVSGFRSSQQGLQVPIVSSSVKGSNAGDGDEDDVEDGRSKVNEKESKPLIQDEVSTSEKVLEIATLPVPLEEPIIAERIVPEKRRARTRNAASKQTTKQRQDRGEPSEKITKRTAASTSASSANPRSSQRASEKQTRNVKNGDLVWGQMRGFPSWPGKVVKPSEVRGLLQRAPLSEGKVWVKWFGDHTFTQMNPADLVSMTEGLEAHHRSRKKGRTRTRKISLHLETAIQEAVDELEQQQGDKKTHIMLYPVPPVVELPGTLEAQEKPRRGRKRKGT